MSWTVDALHKVAWGIVVAWLLVISALMGYWASNRDLPSVTMSATAVGTDAVRGKFLSVHWRVHRYRYCETVRNDFIIDSHGVRWAIPAQTFIVQPGPLGEEIFNTLTPVPMYVPEGPAKLKVQLVYFCDPLDRFITGGPVEWTEIPFNIIDGPILP